MNISIELTPDLLRYLKSKEESGTYISRSEIVRDALRRMMRDDVSVAAESMTMEEFERRKKEVGEELVRETHPKLL